MSLSRSSFLFLFLLLICQLEQSYCQRQQQQQLDEDDEFFGEPLNHHEEEEEEAEENTPSQPTKGGEVSQQERDEEEEEEQEEDEEQERLKILQAEEEIKKQKERFEEERRILLQKTFSVSNYLLEIGYLSFIIIYTINFFYGSYVNRSIASAWRSRCGRGLEEAMKTRERPMLRHSSHRYSHLLIPNNQSPEPSLLFVWSSLQLIKRHDLLFSLGSLLAFSQDILKIDIALRGPIDPFIFALVPRRQEKSARKRSQDLTKFCSGKAIDLSRSVEKYGAISKSHVVVTDCLSSSSEDNDLVRALLHPSLLSTLNHRISYFHSFHITDNFDHPKHKHVLSFQFYLPSNEEEMKNLQELVEWTLRYVFVVSNIRLSQFDKSRAIKERARVKQLEKTEENQKSVHEQRQEAAQKRKEEKKKRVEKELGPEALQKLEAKEEKKALRKKTMAKFKTKVL